MTRQMFRGYFKTHIKEDLQFGLQSGNGMKTTKQEDSTLAEMEKDAQYQVLPYELKFESYVLIILQYLRGK